MAKCHSNTTIDSLVLDRTASRHHHHHHHHHFRLWTSFSGATFRRKLIDAIACGGASFSSSRHHRRDDDDYFETDLNFRKDSTDGKTEKSMSVSGSEKLSDLLNLSEWSPSEETCESEKRSEMKRKVEALDELKRAVKMLQCCEEEGGEEEETKKNVIKRAVAAANVRMLAKENAEARSTMAMLGVIPLLVGMLDDDGGGNDLDSQISSLYALLNLGIGNDLNKAAIVKAGAVHKMLKLIDSPTASPNTGISEAIIANFLGLSALDSNKSIIGSSGAIPLLVKVLKCLDSKSRSQAKQDSLRALYNLSILHSNIPFMLETDLIPFLMNGLGDMEVSERNLSILSNVVSTPEGRKAVCIVPDVFPILVDVLNWTDSPGCQEKASYILMVMAHKAYGDRQAMIDAGIVSALLELTLVGSTLAQKRASRILECMRIDKGKQVSESYGGCSGTTLSAPICGSSSSSVGPNHSPKECPEEENESMMSAERKAVKQLVQQSLQNNMKRIVKRANLPQDFIPSDHLKALTSCSTSKSLPF